MSASAASSGEYTLAADAAGASLELRWISFVAGRTPDDDYRPVGSLGVDPRLLDEVRKVSIAFHPHNEIRQFPTRRPVFLFFRAASTGEYVLTRVQLQAGNEYGRPALESYTLILTAADLRDLGGDPLGARMGVLLDRVRQISVTGSTQPLLAALDLPATPAEASPAPPLAPEDAEWLRTGGERSSTDANAFLLARYCQAEAAAGRAPRSFVTWWESGKRMPPERFDLALRGISPRGVELRDLERAVAHLMADLQAYLAAHAPAAEEARREAEGIGRSAAGFQARMLERSRSYGALNHDQFAALMAENSRELTGLAGRLAALARSDSRPESPALSALSERCGELAAALLQLKHPLPLAWAAVHGGPALAPRKPRPGWLTPLGTGLLLFGLLALYYFLAVRHP